MKKEEFISFLVDVKEVAVEVAKNFTKLAKVIDAFIGDDEKNPKAIEAKPAEVVDKPVEEKKAITLEEVRTVLANLSRNGKTKEVKELLQKYGAEKLSAIKPEDYEALLHDAEAI